MNKPRKNSNKAKTPPPPGGRVAKRVGGIDKAAPKNFPDGSVAPEDDKLQYMDYVHGDVVDNEFDAACFYEYSRFSRVLKRAADLRPSVRDINIIQALRDEGIRGVGDWLHQTPFFQVWQTSDFPQKSWNQLDSAQRHALLAAFPSPRKPQPLRMLKAWELKAHGILDALQKMVDDEQTKWMVNPTVEGWPSTKDRSPSPDLHAVFLIDFRKSRTALCNDFKAWLEIDSNKRRFEKFEDTARRTSKDRLKDLAAKRIFVGDSKDDFNRAQDFVFKNRLKDKAGNPRPFHDVRTGEKSKDEMSEALPYRLRARWEDARNRADQYLKELFPWEFLEQEPGHLGMRALTKVIFSQPKKNS